MKFIFKFLSDLKLCTNSFAVFTYHFISKAFTVDSEGEYNYFVVTSSYDLIGLVKGKAQVDNFINTATKYGFISKVEDEKVIQTVLSRYKGNGKYKKPHIYCVTPLIVLLSFLEFLSSSTKTKKETQVKYSIYDRMVSTIKSGKPILSSIITSLNAHKYIYEKEKLSEIKNSAIKIIGWYRAYKKLDTTAKS